MRSQMIQRQGSDRNLAVRISIYKPENISHNDISRLNKIEVIQCLKTEKPKD